MNTLKQYLSLAINYPEMFANLEGDGLQIILQEEEISQVESLVGQRLEKKGLPIEWAKIGIVYQDQYLLILRDAVRFPGGQFGTYIRIVDQPNSSPGVAIMPIYQQQILLVRHFRHATRSWHLEIPRGFGEKGLSSTENARREIMEEISAEIYSLVSIGKMHLNTGMTSECVDLYFAELKSFGEFDIKEGISKLLPIDVSELERMICENEITDSFTIAAYTRAKLQNLL
ncbi:NUDIX hydrolase [Anabaena cylindrica FACHB-243]|uniref:NUDIX hydrolase n=1 Tax=Anabaena cylindrica (strain ATCC 27899 / PCC 7122) TaxID=272123 RepID=K9ZLX6_ANACC|nr:MULTISPECIES: NUDIX hydrolase [Anabaena]AFZ60233.1 NUDIX hydrolase [Anabaena cylindrica PCC 7122]MBD2417714.1 NUDIX hydrolase [Anabaena cylindrica FACHB-243]MBY5281291.1 NUDIX hydrolase [Anabaena sp. CCAP 1446/1C]MBY5306896.1 NUDIX hydrolase [Anabaena sp. CCAP 1446/1C]MCM2404629.1 NUDIX hydrolase [Anabaena sp. CCAP 1446/1C]